MQNLAHLERLLEVAGGAVVVLTCYSRSCGICKDVLREVAGISHELAAAKARTVFLVHDIMDPADWLTDVARFYKARGPGGGAAAAAAAAGFTLGWVKGEVVFLQP